MSQLRKEQIRRDNYVIVNIWRDQKHGGHNVGHVSLQIAGDPRSSEPDRYLSLWPGPRKGLSLNRKIAKYFEIREAKFNLDYDTDMAFEGVCESKACFELATLAACRRSYVPIYANPTTGLFASARAYDGVLDRDTVLIEVEPVHADKRFVLFGLDREAILQRMRAMDSSSFRLIGSNILMRSGPRAHHNCASYASELLRAGSQLFKSIDRQASSQGDSIRTPEDLYKLVKHYKQCELKARPASQEWAVPGLAVSEQAQQQPQQDESTCRLF